MCEPEWCISLCYFKGCANPIGSVPIIQNVSCEILRSFPPEKIQGVIRNMFDNCNLAFSEPKLFCDGSGNNSEVCLDDFKFSYQGDPSHLLILKDVSMVPPLVSICLRGFTFNPIQAGVFWYHIGWGAQWGAHCAPLRFSFICCPITTKLGMIVLWHILFQGQ